MANAVNHLPDLEADEMYFIQGMLQNMTDDQASQFASIYRSRRKEPQMVLVAALIGFVGFAGIHRFLIGHIGMGILYFFTGGLCVIGTIVDIINYKSLAFEYNIKEARYVQALMSTQGGAYPPQKY